MRPRLALALLLVLTLSISVRAAGLALDLNLPPPDESNEAVQHSPALLSSNADELGQRRTIKRTQYRTLMDRARQGARSEPIVLWGRERNMSKGEYIELRRQRDREYRARRRQDPEVHERDLQLRRQYRARSKSKNSESYQKHRERSRQYWIRKKSALDSDPIRRQAHLRARRDRAQKRTDAKAADSKQVEPQ